MQYLTAVDLSKWLKERQPLTPAPLIDPWIIESQDERLIDDAFVAVRLPTTRVEVYLHRTCAQSPEWAITFEPRPADIVTTASKLLSLMNEIKELHDLAVYLQDRTAASLHSKATTKEGLPSGRSRTK